MAVFLTASVMIVIAAMQVPPLISRKEWPELAGFGVMWFFAAAYAIMIAAEVPIPPATEIVGQVLEAIYRFLGLEIILSI